MWAAFWMVPTNGSGSSELDGFEIVGSYPGYVFETTHNIVSGVESTNLQWSQTILPSDGFHTYGVDWEPTTITWYIDGVAVATAPTPSNMHTPMSMIVNLAVGTPTSWPGAPTGPSELPQVMQIDYVRAYATANTVDVGGRLAILPGTGTASLSGTLLYSSAGAAGVAVANFDVTLVNSVGDVVANAVTDSTGRYSFTGLAAGTYQVQFPPPANEVLLASGPANPGSALTAPITLVAGQAYAMPVETFIDTPAIIEGQVLAGATSATNPDPGVTVELLSSKGAVLATAVTDASGDYVFGGLYAGAYEVLYQVPAGKGLSAGGPASPVTLTTGILNASVGETIALDPETIVPAGTSITGSVLGSPGGAGASGLAGVGIALLNAAGTVIATTATNGNGDFLFTGLSAGTYAVAYAPPAGYVLAPGGGANALGVTSAVTLKAGQAFGLPDENALSRPGSVSGTVLLVASGYWKMAGMTVNLLSSSGAVMASTTTNGSGVYAFGNLMAGSYEIQYVLPTGAAFYSGPENFTTGITPAFALATGQTLTTSGADIKAAQPSTLGGLVQFEAAGSAAAGQAGVTVSVLDQYGDVLSSAVTAASGGFLFRGMLPGSYELSYAAPAGDILLSGPANASSGNTNPITITAGMSNGQAAEILAPDPGTASITGSLTYDGAADATVAITLLNSTGQTIATDYTDSTGSFQFSDLAAGSYQVQFSAAPLQVFSSGPANNTSGLTAVQTLSAGQDVILAPEALQDTPGSIAGSVISAGAVAAGVVVTLLNAGGKTVATSTTSTAGAFSFAGLAAGSYAVHYALAAGRVYGAGPADSVSGTTALLDLTTGQALTLGTETLLATAGALTGTVTYAGAADPGVAVTLLNASGTTVGSTVTGGGGAFAFTGLTPGSYKVQYAKTSVQVFASGPAGATGLTGLSTVGAGQTVTLGAEDIEPAPATLAGSVTYAGAALAGFSVSLLNSAGVAVASTVTGGGGAFQFAGLAPGQYAVAYNASANQVFASGPADPSSGDTGLQVLAAGQTLQLGTEDLEPGLAEIKGAVQVSPGGSNPVAASGVTVTLLDGSGDVIASTMTGSSGSFDFTGVAAGAYALDYAPSAGAVLGYGGAANAASGTTAPFTASAGQVLTVATEQELTAPASIGGSMTFLGGGYWPLQGFAVTLLSSTGATLGTVSTDSQGNFVFGALASGTYQLLYSLPANAAFYSGYENFTTGLSSALTVTAGQAYKWYNVGVKAVSGAVINGTVLYASTAGGSATPQAGVTVSLLNAYGTVILNTVSNSSGAFHFRGMLQGSYQLRYTAPGGQTLAAGGPASVTTGLTAPIVLTAGQTLGEAAETLVASAAKSALSGSVTYKGAALAGAAVTLLDGSGNVVSNATTAAAGAFQFTGLAPGSYQVQYNAGAMQIFAAGPGNAATGLTAPVSLVAGQTTQLANEDIEDAPAEITGAVQVSASGTNPAPAAGVTVTLLDGAGNVVTSAVTGGAGTYDFTGLAAGTYVVEYTPQAGAALEIGGASLSTGKTAPQTVTPGQTLAMATQQVLTAPASISGPVTFQGGGYWRLQGLPVTLLSAAGVALATAVTNSSGVFTFSGLASGTYQVLYTPPPNSVFYGGYENRTTGLSTPLTVTAGQNLSWYNVGLEAIAGGVIAGAVQSGGAAQAGVAVALLNAYGTTILTTTTNAYGNFQFKGLLQGVYQLQYASPAGEVLPSGGWADPTTGLTKQFSLGVGQTVSVATEALMAAVTPVAVPTGAAGGTGAIGGLVEHAGQGDQGTGQSGVAVTLFDANGNAVTSTVTAGDGTFSFGGVAAGNYQVGYMPPGDEVLSAGSVADPGSGLSPVITVTAGGTAAAGTEVLTSISNSFGLIGNGAAAVRGAGNFVVTGGASDSSLALGDGNQSVNLTGGGDTITVGAGNSTIVALGGGNLINTGAGMSFITVGSTGGDVIDLNGSGQGSIEISGFGRGDVLDIAAATAGLGIANDFSNLGSFLTATSAQGSTTLAITPAGGNPYTIAVLDGVSTSVSQLIAAKAFSLA